jgi:hypothetical protein
MDDMVKWWGVMAEYVGAAQIALRQSNGRLKRVRDKLVAAYNPVSGGGATSNVADVVARREKALVSAFKTAIASLNPTAQSLLVSSYDLVQVENLLTAIQQERAQAKGLAKYPVDRLSRLLSDARSKVVPLLDETIKATIAKIKEDRSAVEEERVRQRLAEAEAEGCRSLIQGLSTVVSQAGGALQLGLPTLAVDGATQGVLIRNTVAFRMSLEELMQGSALPVSDNVEATLNNLEIRNEPGVSLYMNGTLYARVYAEDAGPVQNYIPKGLTTELLRRYVDARKTSPISTATILLELGKYYLACAESILDASKSTPLTSKMASGYEELQDLPDKSLDWFLTSVIDGKQQNAAPTITWAAFQRPHNTAPRPANYADLLGAMRRESVGYL